MIDSIQPEDEITVPSKGGCQICWKDESHGLLIKNDVGGWVHQHCLDYFDVDSVSEFEQKHF